jgi:hypothetical protein
MCAWSFPAIRKPVVNRSDIDNDLTDAGEGVFE